MFYASRNTDLRKFDDLYGKKLEMKDCGLARTLAQKPQLAPESYVNAACKAVRDVVFGGGEIGPMPFSIYSSFSDDVQVVVKIDRSF